MVPRRSVVQKRFLSGGLAYESSRPTRVSWCKLLRRYITCMPLTLSIAMFRLPTYFSVVIGTRCRSMPIFCLYLCSNHSTSSYHNSTRKISTYSRGGSRRTFCVKKGKHLPEEDAHLHRRKVLLEANLPKNRHCSAIPARSGTSDIPISSTRFVLCLHPCVCLKASLLTVSMHPSSHLRVCTARGKQVVRGCPRTGGFVRSAGGERGRMQQ